MLAQRPAVLGEELLVDPQQDRLVVGKGAVEVEDDGANGHPCQSVASGHAGDRACPRARRGLLPRGVEPAAGAREGHRVGDGRGARHRRGRLRARRGRSSGTRMRRCGRTSSAPVCSSSRTSGCSPRPTGSCRCRSSIRSPAAGRRCSCCSWACSSCGHGTSWSQAAAVLLIVGGIVLVRGLRPRRPAERRVRAVDRRVHRRLHAHRQARGHARRSDHVSGALDARADRRLHRCDPAHERRGRRPRGRRRPRRSSPASPRSSPTRSCSRRSSARRRRRSPPCARRASCSRRSSPSRCCANGCRRRGSPVRCSSAGGIALLAFA